MRKNKRGISGIITAVIMIALVMTVSVIVWIVVRNMVESGLEQINYNAKCLEINIEASAVVNTSETDYSVTLTRTASGDEIAGVKLVFFNATDDASSVIDVPGNIVPLATVIKSVDGEIINSNKVKVTAYFEDVSGNEKPCLLTNSYSF